jgi:cytochrome b561
MALMIVANYVFEQFMHRLEVSPLKWQFYDLHKSVGLTVLFIVALRLAWRAFNPVPQMPQGVSPTQRLAARVSHAVLYVCMFAMPLSGFIGSKAGGFKASWFGLFEMPDLFGKDDAINWWAEAVHMVTAYVLAAMVVLHAAAAIYHHVALRDDVLRRMLTGRSGMQAAE